MWGHVEVVLLAQPLRGPPVVSERPRRVGAEPPPDDPHGRQVHGRLPPPPTPALPHLLEVLLWAFGDSLGSWQTQESVISALRSEWDPQAEQGGNSFFLFHCVWASPQEAQMAGFGYCLLVAVGWGLWFCLPVGSVPSSSRGIP